MSDPQRREFLAAAAGVASLAALSGSQPAVAGDPSFTNNVPDPNVSGMELPTFKFALEKSQGTIPSPGARGSIPFAILACGGERRCSLAGVRGRTENLVPRPAAA